MASRPKRRTVELRTMIHRRGCCPKSRPMARRLGNREAGPSVYNSGVGGSPSSVTEEPFPHTKLGMYEKRSRNESARVIPGGGPSGRGAWAMLHALTRRGLGGRGPGSGWGDWCLEIPRQREGGEPPRRCKTGFFRCPQIVYSPRRWGDGAETNKRTKHDETERPVFPIRMD